MASTGIRHLHVDAGDMIFDMIALGSFFRFQYNLASSDMSFCHEPRLPNEVTENAIAASAEREMKAHHHATAFRRQAIFEMRREIVL